MKKIYATIVLLVSVSLGALFSQDIIVLKSGDEVKSKVLEITSNEVKYKRFDNLEGPIISILKSEIFMIKYQNGTKEVINSNNSAPSPVQTESSAIKKFVDPKPNRAGLYINPLGFVQFGPMIGTEITRNSNVIWDAHIRLSSLGALMYVVNASDDGEKPYKISGMGVGGGVKSFFPSRIGGLYVGGIFEYGWHTNYFSKGESWEWQSEVKYVVAMTSIGYKFRFESGFYINTGLYLGAEYTFSDKWYYTKPYYNDTSVHIEDPSIGVDGMLEVSFGIDF